MSRRTVTTRLPDDPAGPSRRPAPFPVSVTSLRRALVTVSVCGALALQAAAALARQDDVEAAFSEAIDVRVVNVEVVVTDEQGRRVHDLTPSDFRVLIDGQPVPIDYFSEIREGRAVTAGESGGATLPALQPNAFAGTSFLVFIDDSFSIKQDRDRVLDHLEDDLTKLGPADHMAIVAFDGSSMTKLTDWTNSSAKLAASLEQARGREALGLNRLQERMTIDTARGEQALMRREAAETFVRGNLTLLQARNPQARRGHMEDTSSDHDVRSTVLDEVSAMGPDRPLDQVWATSLERQLRRSVLAATASLRGLANPPGRKVMLLLTGGWPVSPAAFAVADRPSNAEHESVPEDDRLMSQESLYGPLMSAANLVGYTLYPVDVPGFSPELRGDASVAFDLKDEPETAFISDSDSTRPIGATQARGQAFLLERELLHHATLTRLARATGGLPMINERRDAALASVVADTGSYYWLGVQLERRADDRARDLEARLVDRPNLRVRTREGYIDLSGESEVMSVIDAALLFGDPPSTRSLEVQPGAPQRAGKRLRIPLEIGVPLDDVFFLSVGGTWRAEVEVWIAAMDEAGNRSEAGFRTFAIVGDHAPSPGQIFYIDTGMDLRKRQRRFVIAVHDPRSGAILTSTGTIDRR